MAVDLYGDTYVDNWDYARKIVTLGAKLPFYKVSSLEMPNRGCSMALFLEGFNFFQPRFSEIDVSGIYAIYEKTKVSTTCLYVGSTGYSMHQRVYRFVKELRGLSRDDEEHSAATKARRDGVSPEFIYAKLMPRTIFPKVNNLRVDYKTLDETCAVMLKSRYNVRRTY